jgi:hypothetical protein
MGAEFLLSNTGREYVSCKGFLSASKGLGNMLDLY